MSAPRDQGIPAEEDAAKAFGRARLDEEQKTSRTRPHAARELGDLVGRQLDERIAHHHEIGARQLVAGAARGSNG